MKQTVDLGSHTLFIGKPTEMEVLSDVLSATYAFYQEHIKPKQQVVKSAGKVWMCKYPKTDFELQR